MSVAVTAPLSGRATRTATLPWWLLVAGVAALAFAVRLLAVLRGGGLYGLGDYDDGVYYGAAVGLVHGRLPYRDFLLLHPPGIVLALAPFAALGRLRGDPTGFAAARMAWMALGALNTALVCWVLRPTARWVALLAGLAYALFLPAVYGEHTTQLEAPGTTCLLVAVALLGVNRPRPALVALAGAALGVSAGVKIWGVVPVLLTAGWLLATAGRRRAATLVLGAVAGATVICLPFFLAAPGPMFRMVVHDQLGRPRLATSMTTRVSQILGLWGPAHHVTAGMVVVAAAMILFAVLAASTSAGRLAVVLLLGLTVMLLLTPSWFKHYATLIAAPAALTFGYGVAALLRRLRHRGAQTAAGLGLVALLAAYAAPVFTLHLNEPFPGRALGAVVAGRPGCVTTDDPTTLIEMNVLGRNLDRGCLLVVDLGGHSYDEPPPRPFPRMRDQTWQRYALSYLKSGSVNVISRFSSGQGFSRATALVVGHWHVLHRFGRFALRRAAVARGS